MDENGCGRGCVPSRKDWHSVAEQNGCLRYQRVMGKEVNSTVGLWLHYREINGWGGMVSNFKML